jgi:hypothetical protein
MRLRKRNLILASLIALSGAYGAIAGDKNKSKAEASCQEVATGVSEQRRLLERLRDIIGARLQISKTDGTFLQLAGKTDFGTAEIHMRVDDGGVHLLLLLDITKSTFMDKAKARLTGRSATYVTGERVREKFRNAWAKGYEALVGNWDKLTNSPENEEKKRLMGMTIFVAPPRGNGKNIFDRDFTYFVQGISMNNLPMLDMFVRLADEMTADATPNDANWLGAPNSQQTLPAKFQFLLGKPE